MIYIYNFLSAFFGLYNIIIMSYMLRDKKSGISKKEVFPIICLSAMASLLVKNNIIIFIIMGCILFLIYYVIFEEDFKSYILSLIISIVIMTLFDVTGQMILKADVFEALSYNQNEFVIHVVVFLMLLLISNSNHLFAVVKIIADLSVSYKLIFVYVCICFIFGIKYIDVYRNNIGSEFTICLALSLFVLAVICLLSFYEEKEKTAQNKMKKYNDYIGLYDSLIMDMQISQHEFSNRLESISILPQLYSSYDELSSNLEKYSDIYINKVQNYQILQIKNALLAATFYSFAVKSKEKNVNMYFDIFTNEIHSQVSETDLCDYTSILLQNALDACDENTSIYVSIKSSDNKFILEVRNPVKRMFTYEELTQFFSDGFTSKSDGKRHGFGLHYLKKQVEKNKGEIDVSCDKLDNTIWLTMKFEI